MSGLTSRFKLSRFGGGTPGTILDDGQKFTSLDRDTIDRLLAQTEVHDHLFRPVTLVGPAAPTGALQTNAGTMQCGFTYYYRYAVVDELGAETIASAELAVPTPAVLATPGLPAVSLATDAGQLAPGLYYYGLTAIRGTEETPLGPAVLMALQAGETAVRIDLPTANGATQFRVWRMGSTESGYTKVGVVSASAGFFVDAGSVPADPCACDPGNAPPQVNTGTASYAIAVTLPTDLDISKARGWRLYRTVYPGIYPTTSLVHQVVEREHEWDATSALLRTWVDTGAPLAAGQPMSTDLNMRFQAFTFDSAAALPDPAPYPQRYPLLVGQVLYVKVGTEWVKVTGSGSDPSGGTPASSVLTAPGGGRYMLTVADDGTLTTVTTPFPGPPTPPMNVQVH
jgi:hypothetical protein